jgi:hypothetical protein
MFKPRVYKTLAIIVIIYFLVLCPGMIWPQYLDTPVGLLVAIPFLSVYLFHSIGIPFLLENNGACGWSWCAPTVFGYIFIIVFWLFITWLLAAFIANITGKKDV